MRAIENFFNLLSDTDWTWWPVLSWRPPKNEYMSVKLWLKGTAVFGTLVGVVSFLILNFQHSSTVSWQMTLCVSMAYGWGFIFLAFIPFMVSWNHRADRLNNPGLEADHKGNGADEETPAFTGKAGSYKQFLNQPEKTGRAKVNPDMVYCWGCAHKIHKTAVTCPNCGASQVMQAVMAPAIPQRNKVVLFFVALGWGMAIWFLFIIVISVGIAIKTQGPEESRTMGEKMGYAIGVPLLFLSVGISAIFSVLGILPGTKK